MERSITFAQLLKQVAERLGASAAYGDWPLGELAHQTRTEAEQLVCAAMDWTRLALLQHLPETVPDSAIGVVDGLVRRRVDGEPLAYILGYTHFYGRVFRTRPGALIPRPDTETLVETVLHWIQSQTSAAASALAAPIRVVEIGPGTGCISITLQLECPMSAVTAVDISADAVSLTRENCRRLNASVDVVQGDGFAYILRQGQVGCAFDVIVSNPPYIPRGEIDELETSVRLYEPHLALDGGADGLDFYRRFAALPPTLVGRPGAPAGLFLEVGMGQAEAVAELFRAHSAWQSFAVSLHRDVRGVHRVVAVTREGNRFG
ncbi:peptide chain release factor N(5)-glutamine methyltransferase [Alicyclobacillus suci]|uniref:peptide chain release factor N(5)-glutamine methyltransferase n=1 Tax=Alicyclobacillus suci TaxID=2816080 RepID=UPI001A8DB45F|nr:peptide chain release factor N(5)-glutamine methyltransferase [Alicyclobacillus suci]